MKKRFFVIALSALMLFTLFAFTACGGTSGGYDDQALKDRIAELESENASLKNKVNGLEGDIDDLQDQLDALQPSSKIYQVNETFTMYNNGIKLFSVTYVSKDDGYFNVKITNHNVFGMIAKEHVVFCFFNSATKSFAIFPSSSNTIAIDAILTQSRDIVNNSDYVYVGYPTGTEKLIPYAVFKI